jgi:hypothetical protein
MKSIILYNKNQFFFVSIIISLILVNTCISIENSKNTISQIPAELLSLNTTTTWHEYISHSPNLKKETCAWISFITFKSKQTFNLKQINLKWIGASINSNKISASLYQKKENNNAPLIPIEENLVGDGKWNKSSQEIIFDLNEKLVAINKYYLVLSFPEKLKTKIKNGEFILKDSTSLKLEKLE